MSKDSLREAKSRSRGTTRLPQKRVAQVIRRMRTGNTSLRRSARELGISPRTVLRRAGSVLKKGKGGRYSAKPSDRLERLLLMPTPEGPREIATRNSREASRLGRYWAALHKYYETGDASDLRKFTGQFITGTGGAKFPLLTDLGTLDRLGSAGVLQFESLYAWSE